MPIILSSKSWRNPFMTDITIIKVATPIIIPKKENIAVTDIKPSLLFESKYLIAMKNSSLLNIFIIYQFPSMSSIQSETLDQEIQFYIYRDMQLQPLQSH